jgi:galactitol-specific phosphotransferase system IIC component
MGRMISAIVYGLDVKSADEVSCISPPLIYLLDNILAILPLFRQYIVDAEAVNTMFGDAVTLGAHLVDFLPFRMSMQSCS